MAAADKRDGWRFNSMQFLGVFVWHMLGMPESDYPIVKARLKCWLIIVRSSAAKPRLPNFLSNASPPLPLVLGFRLGDRLPLHVGDRVRAATGEGFM
jgi:hypothetical protein